MRRNQSILLGAGMSVVFAAIGAWLLIDYWQRRAPVEDPQAEAMARQSELDIQQMQDTLNEKITGTQTSAQQDRMESPLGLAMFRTCAEWTEFNDNHPSDDARANEERACAEYRQYIETGNTPE